MSPGPDGITHGTVRELRHDGRVHRATVAVDAAVPCRRCAEGRGCGAGLFHWGTRDSAAVVELPEGFDVRVGDTLALAVPERTLLCVALLAYGAPLGGAVTMAAAAALAAGQGDAGTAVAAITGLALGFVLARRRLARLGAAQLAPRIAA